MFQRLLPENFLLPVDSYKFGHIWHLPSNVRVSHSNIVPRKPFKDAERGIFIDEIVVMGPQVVAEYLAHAKVTTEMIDEAEVEVTEQGYRFPRAEWEAIRDLGYIPVKVRALPEGTVVKPGVPIMTVENTDERFPWLPAYIETWAQDIVWCMTTIASKVRYLRKQADLFCEGTGTPTEAAEYMIHNFGDRGAGGRDRALMAGMAHALFFSGSDCSEANRYIKRLYNERIPFLSSVDANEHSVVCANSDCEAKDDREAFEMSLRTLERVVEQAEGGIGIPLISCLIDTFDDERYIKEFVIPNFDRITAIGGKYVCRPDSGNAVTKPVEVVKWLKEGLGAPENGKGFACLPENVGVIQGDGLKLWDFGEIFKLAVNEHLAASNFVFGFGGGMTNGVTRDDFSFSMKATANKLDDGTWVSLQKSPKTDTSKKSLSGRVTALGADGGIVAGQYGEVGDVMKIAYLNGTAGNGSTFTDIRKRARG